MWEDVSKISGLPPFRLSSSNAATTPDKLLLAKIIDIERKEIIRDSKVDRTLSGISDQYEYV